MAVAEGQEQAYYGLPNVNQESCNSVDLDLCPMLVLAFISALGAAALVAMYLAATQNANGKRKRRRSLPDPIQFGRGLGDVIAHGKDSLRFLDGGTLIGRLPWCRPGDH